MLIVAYITLSVIVYYLEITPGPHTWQRTDDYDGEDNNEDDPSDWCKVTQSTHVPSGR